MKKVQFILILGGLLSACHWQKVPPVVESLFSPCVSANTDLLNLPNRNLVCHSPTMCDDRIVGPYAFKSVAINPLNKDEICFIREGGSKRELCTFNLCTRKLTILTDIAFYDTDWSTKGWIAFVATDRNIWKIKDNGDSLTRLTNTSKWEENPKWSPLGMKLLYSIDATYPLRIIDKEGKWTDTITVIQSDIYAWASENDIIFIEGITNPKVQLYQLTGKIITSKGNMTGQLIGNLNMINSNKMLSYTSQTGFYIYDIDNQTYQTLTAYYMFGSKKYNCIDYVSGGNYFLTTCLYREWEDSIEGVYKLRIFPTIVSIDGKEEREVKIP